MTCDLQLQGLLCSAPFTASHLEEEINIECLLAQVYILDGKAFAALEESGQQHSEVAVDDCMLLRNNQVLRRASVCCLCPAFGHMWL